MPAHNQLEASQTRNHTLQDISYGRSSPIGVRNTDEFTQNGTILPNNVT